MPFLVLGNKIDVQTAVSEDEFRVAMGLMRTVGKVHIVATRDLCVCVRRECYFVI